MLQEPQWYRYAKGIVAGTFAGITVTFIGHPFDTLKVRLQVQSQNNKVYNGVVDCFLKTMKWEGIGGLYKGVGSPLAGQVLVRTSLFTTFYESLEFMSKGKRKLTEMKRHEYYIAGAATGSFTTIFDSPIDLFKSKMQIRIINEKMNLPVEYPYKNVFHCGYIITTTYGVRGMFQGFFPTLVRNTIGYCLYFGTFEYLKRALLRKDQNIDTIEPWKIILAGALGGILFWSTVYNIDVVKSAMMADHIDPRKRVYKNTLDCFKKLYLEEGGYRRFWRGFAPCLMRSAPANGIMLFTVDKTRSMLPSYDTFSNLW